MTSQAIKGYTKKVIPKFILQPILKARDKKNIDLNFANFILDSAIEFSDKIHGDVSSFDNNLRNLIVKSDNNLNSMIQDILTAFMPDFKNNLYRYYKNQEFLIFYRFLSYPFSSSLSDHLMPYKEGLFINKHNDILDYGAGIPYGLIKALLNNKNSINSITLIDLDLVHVDFVEFLIQKIAPNIKLKIYRLTDAEIFPEIDGQYNFFFGKDVFEHLKDPLKNLKKLMSHSKPECVCYFDFSDHGEVKYQHISPNLPFLSDEMLKFGFKKEQKMGALTQFIRTNDQ